MADSSNKKTNQAKQVGSYSVGRASSRPGRTVTFTVPTMPRPTIKRPPAGRVRYALIAVAFVLVAGVSGFAGASLRNTGNDDGIFSTTVGNQKKVVSSQSQLISQIAKSVGPSVVSVTVDIDSSSSDNSSLSQLYSLYGYSQPSSQEEAAGTGIVLSSSGIIMTNRHVVPSGTTKVSVTLSDGTELKDVSVIGRTNDNDSLDVAFLKINDLKGHKLSPATIGDSSSVQVGDDVVAIGNALGQFQNTVTAGIISGYGRSVQAGDSSGSSDSTENLDNLFQTDAAINEGNSGGPLVNLNGQVIGMNTAIAGDAQNIGFAIPVDDVRGLIKQVLKTGKFSRPYLGVAYIPLTADVASQLDLKVQQGAYIAPSSDGSSPSVISGGPADKAGLQEKDIITEVDGTKIDQSHSLGSLLGIHTPGDKVSLTILRDDKTIHISATLGTQPTAASQ